MTARTIIPSFLLLFCRPVNRCSLIKAPVKELAFSPTALWRVAGLGTFLGIYSLEIDSSFYRILLQRIQWMTNRAYCSTVPYQSREGYSTTSGCRRTTTTWPSQT